MVIEAAGFHPEMIANSFERLWKYDLVGVNMLEACSNLHANNLRDMIRVARDR